MSEVIGQRSRESHLDACVAQGGAYKFLIQKSNQRIKHVLVYLDNYSRVETGIDIWQSDYLWDPGIPGPISGFKSL